MAPQYLTDLLTPYTPSRNLRSSDLGHLTVPKVKLKKRGERAFAAAGPKLWNSLPPAISLSPSPAPLSYCCYLRQTNGQTRAARQIAMTAKGIPVRVSDLFWSNTSAISSKIEAKGVTVCGGGIYSKYKIKK